MHKEPICQECLKEGKINAGSVGDSLQVHHIKSPFQNGTINYELAFDDNNLRTICSYHHGLEHGAEHTPEEIIAALDAFFADIPD